MCFFCKEHLYVFLSFHKLLHFFPRFAVVWVSCFLLGQQFGILCIQSFDLRQLFQTVLIEKVFCRFVQCKLLPMNFQKFSAIARFAVGIVDRAGLGIVDDMRPQDGDFCHPFFSGLDGVAQLVILGGGSIHALPHLFDASNFLLLQENQRFGHFFQIIPLCPACIAVALTLGQFCLDIHQQLERLLFRRLFLVGMVLGFTSDNSFQFVLTVACAQSVKPDKTLLPCALNGSVFSALDLVTLFLQLLEKIFVVFGVLSKDSVDDSAQPVAVALFWRIECALLPLPVRLYLNDRKLVLQANQVA